MAEKKKTKKRVQVNGKAGSGMTINMSGLAKMDEALREVGVKIRLEPLKRSGKPKSSMKKVVKGRK